MAERNPKPKEVFLATKRLLDFHQDIFARPETNACLQTALAQYARILTDLRLVDGQSAAASHFKLQGAQDLVNILLNLGESPLPMPKAAPDNLDHTK